MHTLHPLSAAAGPYEVHRDTAPGVLARLLMMWVLCCALPSVGIALLILIRLPSTTGTGSSTSSSATRHWRSSAGSVFAGYVGAENRHEYTVIGDPVNEAARLADRAKQSPGRVICSGAAHMRADDAERANWASEGSAVLRGRGEVALMWVPADCSRAAP